MLRPSCPPNPRNDWRGRRIIISYPHMAGLLRKLFGSRPTVEQLASGGDREAFLRALGETDIFVIAAMEGDGLDPSAMTKEQLLAEIERAAKDLNERQDGFAPFVYERNGRRRLPFFTSNDHAQTFVGEYSKERNRVYPFQLLRRERFIARPASSVVRQSCDERSHRGRSRVVGGRRVGDAANVGITKRCSGPGGRCGPRHSRVRPAPARPLNVGPLSAPSGKHRHQR